ncbi:exopolysaccharide biosynthesis GT4 family glycosyltransferase EpsE [Cognatishimia maritima]|uniref:Glycosyltransferase involved in cell wall bisynthesis n=1 Tax=Cognatishimia maritima TaxID=870908 RepID=A0A1M5TVH1_9RHOB|nr:exopolysaccharide biosynthesis GT4 family glycosyltransferase EpsE [Cognatishimia maritima]SHH54792.1 Glycosyltransferase involved in cell wall bisynthesis [Cognatishimia maritima]
MTALPKIGYLIPEFPGQTHIFFWREIRALERMGISVALFSTRRPAVGLISHQWSDEAMARTTYLANIDPLAAAQTAFSVSPTVYAKDVLREGKTLGRDLAMITAAAKYLKESCAVQGISHVHVHSCGRAALVAVLAQQMGGPSYSLTLHGPMSDYGSGQRLKWRHAKFATVITEKLKAELPSQLGPDMPKRVFVQPMGVDLQDLQRNAPYQPYTGAQQLKLFSCGRLNIVKGHQDLIDAVKLLRDRGLDVHLTIAGEDDDGGSGYHHVLNDKISELKLENAVTLLGAISAEEVRRHLLEAHLFVLASWHEPLGVAYMEAMACEVPTIGTNAGGVPELIRHGLDGLLTDPQTPKALAAAIQLLATSPEDAVRLGQAGRQRVLAKFDCRRGAELIAREGLDLTISKEI